MVYQLLHSITNFLKTTVFSLPLSEANNKRKLVGGMISLHLLLGSVHSEMRDSTGLFSLTSLAVLICVFTIDLAFVIHVEKIYL